MVSPHQKNCSTGIKRIISKAPAYSRPYRIIRIGFAALLIYADVTKLFDPKAFAATISAYKTDKEYKGNLFNSIFR